MRRLRWPAVAVAAAAIVALGWPRVVARVRTFNNARDVRSRIVDRLDADARFVRAELDTASITAVQRAALRARLDDAAARGAAMRPELTSGTTVLPLNDAHAAILAVHGAMLAAMRGLTPLVVWKSHRYDAVPLLAIPPPEGGARPIDIVLMSGEQRADAFLLTNASGDAGEATVHVSGVPGAPRPEWLALSAVEWTDTRQAVPVADALPDAPRDDETFRVAVPAGMTRKVWLTVDGSRLAPGTYQGTLTVRAPQLTAHLAFTVRVSRVTMARPRLSLGMWDFTNGDGTYAITPRNRDRAIALMRSHLVDSPWATGAVLPWPAAAGFDAGGELARPLDFAALDEWIRRWPDARRYFIVAGAGDRFAGAPIDTPEFAARLAAWGRALAQHAAALGLAPQQLGLLLVDEPRDAAQNRVIAAWARVLKTAAPGLGLFENPIWPRPDEVSPPDAFTLVDDLCFHLGVYSRGGEPVARYYEARRAAGQRLWIYQTTGPARLLDPTSYYRLAGWYAVRAHAVGIAFWAFGDTGGAESSWNEYAGAMGLAYAPAFVDPQGVTGSVHWQAVREGVEDAEYLAMLGDAVARTTDAAWKARAIALAREALAEVPKPYTGWFDWDHDASHARPDEYRLRILSLLEAKELRIRN